MPYNRKSQGLSINVVVIAAILIIVLIIILMIFTKSMGETAKEFEQCKGKCMSETLCNEKGVIVSEGQEDCNNPWTPTESGGGRISLSGRDVCCFEIR